MSENIPPNAGTAAISDSAANQPGRPYYESLRATLRSTLEKKRKLDEQVAAIEDQIFKSEGTYLEETANSGNIVRGFDGWVKGVQVGGRTADERRRGRVRDDDRVFSRSSVGWMRVRPPNFHCYSRRGSPRISSWLTVVNRHRKVPTRVHRLMRRRRRLLTRHSLRRGAVTRRLRRARRRKPRIRRNGLRIRIMRMGRSRRRGARSRTRATETSGLYLQCERSKRGVSGV